MLKTLRGRIKLPTEDIKKLPGLIGRVDVLKTARILPGVSAGDEGSAGFYVRGRRS